MAFGLLHTGNDYAPQIVIRCVYLKQTDKQKQKDRHPYELIPVPGFFRPDMAMPVGDGFKCSLDYARELDADPNCPLKLVEMDNEELEQAKAASKQVNAMVQANIAEGKEVGSARSIKGSDDKSRTRRSGIALGLT